MIGISLEDYSISLDGVKILENVNFKVNEGEIVTILGSSGSGKSTILRSIASLENRYKGKILLNETCMVSTKKCNNDIGYIFQDYALFPHLNVEENIAFALYNLNKKERITRTNKLLKQFDLQDHRKKQIHELSGGQQQRVSIARVLIYEPKVLLLDEPFASLDTILRKKTKIWLKNIIKNLGLSVILVTHDQKEALSISDKIGILNNNTIEQFGTPQELFENPCSFYVANFLGSINILPKEINNELGFDLGFNDELILRVNETNVTINKTNYELNVLDLLYCGNYYEVKASFKDFDQYTIEFISNHYIESSKKLYFDLKENKIKKVIK